MTLADVAQQVGVHRTLLGHYFRDRKELFDQVFARRAVVITETRMCALDEYERAAGDAPTVEGVLQAFLDTELALYIQGGEGWRNHAAPGAQVANTPEWGAEITECSRTDTFRSYRFVTGALMLARTGRIDRSSGGWSTASCRATGVPVPSFPPSP